MAKRHSRKKLTVMGPHLGHKAKAGHKGGHKGGHKRGRGRKKV
jgi:hypothetical protein